MNPRLSLLAPLVVLAAGCYVNVEEDHRYVDEPGAPVGEPVYESTIDPGELLETVAGEGAGAFIEYEGGGSWHVFTACDTSLSDYSCLWDVVASSNAPIGGFEDGNLEPDDDVYRYDSNQVVLQANTDFDFDGFRFETTPGETVRFEVWLDGVRDPRYIYWVGDGGLHRGAPSDPIDLAPAAP